MFSRTMDKLLQKLTAGKKKKSYYANRKPLFDRYKLFTVGKLTVNLQHYKNCDPSTGFHDHPWRFCLAIPLAYGYMEERVEQLCMSTFRVSVKLRSPLRPYIIRGLYYHRVNLFLNCTYWSLFITWDRCRSWYTIDVDRTTFKAGRYKVEVEGEYDEAGKAKPRRGVP